MTSREQFEKAWVEKNSNNEADAKKVSDALKRIWITDENGDGEYFDSFVMTAWSWWQDSRNVEMELPPVEKWRSVDAVRAQNAYRVIVEKELVAAGFKVKGG